jgi:hypothetical protein
MRVSVASSSGDISTDGAVVGDGAVEPPTH